MYVPTVSPGAFYHQNQCLDISLYDGHVTCLFVCVCVTIDMGREAAQAALSDARLPYTCVEAVVASYCYGDPTCGELHHLSKRGI